MAANIQQSGSGNIALADVTGSTINITEVMEGSDDHTKMLACLTELKEDLGYAADEEEAAEIEAKIAAQEKLIEKFKKGVFNLADTFSRMEINTERLKRAQAHFEKGEFREAHAVLKAELEQMREENRKLMARKENYDSETLENLKHNADEFLVLAQATAVNFADKEYFEKTCKYFERSIAAYAELDNLFHYATFLKGQNRSSLSLVPYGRIIGEFFAGESVQNRAAALSNMAGAEWTLKMYDEAEEHYLAALRIRREEGGGDIENRTGIADLLQSLSVLYGDMLRWDEAEKSVIGSLEIYTKLAEADPSHLPGVARGYGTLGVRYLFCRDKDDPWKLQTDKELQKKAKRYLGESAKLWQKLAAADPQKYNGDLVLVLNNIGIIRSATGDDAGAVHTYKAALDIYRTLAQKDPAAYQANMALTLGNLAKTYHEKKEYEKAVECFTEETEILERLGAHEPIPHLEKAARAYRSLIDVNEELKDLDGSEKVRLAMCECYRKLYALDPGTNKLYFIRSLYLVGSFYKHQKPDREVSLKYIGEALRLVREMDMSDPEVEDLYLYVLKVYSTGVILKPENDNASDEQKGE